MVSLLNEENIIDKTIISTDGVKVTVNPKSRKIGLFFKVLFIMMYN